TQLVQNRGVRVGDRRRRDAVPDVVGPEVHEHEIGGATVEPRREVLRGGIERIARIGAARPARAGRFQDVGEDVAAVALVVLVVPREGAPRIALAAAAEIELSGHGLVQLMPEPPAAVPPAPPRPAAPAPPPVPPRPATPVPAAPVVPAEPVVPATPVVPAAP